MSGNTLLAHALANYDRAAAMLLAVRRVAQALEARGSLP